MRETIYRDEAIEAILSDLKLVGDFDIDRGIKRACIRRASWRIEDVPSADRWIPCSERLPEEKEVVAVIIKQWDTGEIKKGITYRVDRNMWVGFGRHNEACVWWLPLPPWEGEEENESHNDQR